jgi:hypothetical protein
MEYNFSRIVSVTLGQEHQFDVTDYWGNNGGRAGDANRYHDNPSSPVDINFLNEKVM